jgi:hypothetical protein
MGAVVHCDGYFLAFTLQSISRYTYNDEVSQFREIWGFMEETVKSTVFGDTNL